MRLSATPLAWREILTRTAAEVNRDKCTGLAAQLAFYFVLSLFPALLFLVALIGLLPLESTIAALLDALATVAPGDVLALLREQLVQIEDGKSGGLLTVGIVGALWSSSVAMAAVMDVLNRAYTVAEPRPWWKRRLVAVGLTVVLSLFIVTALAFVLIGPGIARPAAAWLGVGAAFSTLWTVARWPLMIALMVIGVDLVYYYAPNRRGVWVWGTPGALLATLMWLMSSFGFKLYVAHFANYNATYGAIGGVVVLLLWFYVSALAILVGAELNGVVEHADTTSPQPDPAGARR